MFFFIMLGCLITGGLILASKVLSKYWERIRHWLNNTAADAVEQMRGYEARRKLHKAISVVDRFFRMVRGRSVITNVSTVYTKQSEDLYGKTVMVNDVPTDEFEDGFLKELNNASNVMEMEYVQQGNH